MVEIEILGHISSMSYGSLFENGKPEYIAYRTTAREYTDKVADYRFYSYQKLQPINCVLDVQMSLSP